MALTFDALQKLPQPGTPEYAMLFGTNPAFLPNAPDPAPLPAPVVFGDATQAPIQMGGANYQLPALPTRMDVGAAPVRDVRAETRRAMQTGGWAALVGALLGGGQGALAGFTGAAAGARGGQNARAAQAQTEYANKVKATDADFKAQDAVYKDALSGVKFQQGADHAGVIEAQGAQRLGDARLNNDLNRKERTERSIVQQNEFDLTRNDRLDKNAQDQTNFNTTRKDRLGAQDLARTDKKANEERQTKVATLTKDYQLFMGERTTKAGRAAAAKRIAATEKVLGIDAGAELSPDMVASMSPDAVERLKLARDNYALAVKREARQATESANRVVGGGKAVDISAKLTTIRNRMAIVDGKIANHPGMAYTAKPEDKAALQSLRSEKQSLINQGKALRANAPAGSEKLFEAPAPPKYKPQASAPGDYAHIALKSVNDLTEPGSAPASYLPSDFVDQIHGMKALGANFSLNIPQNQDPKNPVAVIKVGGKTGSSNNPAYNDLVRYADQNDLEVGYSQSHKAYIVKRKGSGAVSVPKKQTGYKTKSGNSYQIVD